MLEIQTRIINPDLNIVFVKVKGRIASGNLTELEQQLDEYGSGKPIKLILDLHESEAVDSQGIGMLIKARFDIVNRGGKIVLLGLTDRVRAVLRISGLEEYFLIATDEEKALELVQ
ncbi:MAG TPA: STAS domain-containing protein [Acidobacteriota bacterium]|nr:STAS domain-containing protein [Acidobacteriota bacterium]